MDHKESRENAHGSGRSDLCQLQRECFIMPTIVTTQYRLKGLQKERAGRGCVDVPT